MKTNSRFDVTIYTDGSCYPNPDGPGGWAAILVFGPHRREISGGAKSSTNNRMELTAVLSALTHLTRPCNVTIVTDSKNVIGWLYGWDTGKDRMDPDKKWRRKDSLIGDICRSIDEAVLLGHHQVSYELVKGHSGHPENEICDQLAASARMRHR